MLTSKLNEVNLESEAAGCLLMTVLLISFTLIWKFFSLSFSRYYYYIAWYMPLAAD
jgi:hypothetical protein